MKTKNIYSLPLKKESIIRKDTSSPAHKGGLKYAIDFLCDEGTSILAAKKGKVVELVDNKKKAVLIEI